MCFSCEYTFAQYSTLHLGLVPAVVHNEVSLAELGHLAQLQGGKQLVPDTGALGDREGRDASLQRRAAHLHKALDLVPDRALGEVGLEGSPRRGPHGGLQQRSGEQEEGRECI